ncbi:MAG: hypothetical protein IT536_15355 [Hyphomicrobiales bacterium]|nr:hypothetical protein [Hyphomicrobiales bacterium]
MMTVPIDEDNDAAWVATFLSEAVLAFAESEDRDVTVAPFNEARPVNILSDHRVEGFTLRFGPPGGAEFRVMVAERR